MNTRDLRRLVLADGLMAMLKDPLCHVLSVSASDNEGNRRAFLSYGPNPNDITMLEAASPDPEELFLELIKMYLISEVARFESLHHEEEL